jgi:ribosome maturation factor RimP
VVGGAFLKSIVEELVNSKISYLGIYVSDAFRSSEEGKTIFNIVLDSDEVIDLDKITEASRIINKIMDEDESIEKDYDELDIYSEEKGDVVNE